MEFAAEERGWAERHSQREVRRAIRDKDHEFLEYHRVCRGSQRILATLLGACKS